GDFNNDHVVDAADYVIWRKGLGTTYTMSDYWVWRSQFGQTIPGAGSSLDSVSAVPEPSLGGCLFLGILPALFRRKK
ncbi:MAG: hypothetical protein IT425_12395, partial [Pirellulales bacterium]|nr:hypothetical protein [Pirellulales bacterium]